MELGNLAIIETGALAALILAGTQMLLKYVPQLKGQVATLIVTVVFGLIAFLVVDGIRILEVVLALLGQVFAYDFLVDNGYIAKPLKEEDRRLPGAGGPPRPPKIK